VVSPTVLIGGSAAAPYAHHRESLGNDHVVADFGEPFDVILENLENLKALGD
jgi:hypothetical protein